MEEKIVGEVQDNVRLTVFRDQFVPDGQWQAEQCFGLEFDSPLGLADDGSQLWNPFDPANAPDCEVNLTKNHLLLSHLQAICWSLPCNNIVLFSTLYALIVRSKKLQLMALTAPFPRAETCSSSTSRVSKMRTSRMCTSHSRTSTTLSLLQRFTGFN